MKRKSYLRIAVLLGVVSLSGYANAGVTGSLFVGPNYNGPQVHLKLDGVEKWEAGGSIDLSQLKLGDGEYQSLPFVYCLDMLTDVYVNSTYTPTWVTTDASIWSKLNANTAASYHQLGAVAAGKIAWLLTHVAPTIASDANGTRSGTVGEEQLGLQAAIWSLVYGNSFELLTSSGNINGYYEDYLDALADGYTNGPPGVISEVLWMSPGASETSFGGYQALASTFVTHPLEPSSETVPEPGSVIIWGLAIVALGGRAWHRRKSLAA